jgi:hypothetical protein
VAAHVRGGGGRDRFALPMKRDRSKGSWVITTLACVVACGADAPADSPSEPGGPPTGPPLGTTTLTSGSAEISVSGDLAIRERFEGVSAPAIYRWIPATVTVTWGTGGLVIAGPLRLGSQETSDVLSLQSPSTSTVER